MKLKVLNPRIKVLRPGVAYIELDELVRARIERIKREYKIEEQTDVSSTEVKQSTEGKAGPDKTK